MTGNSTTSKNDFWGRVIVGFLLAVLSADFVAGLLLIGPHQINEALIMMFAGGVGSSVYAIRAYLLHACDRKDFDRAYTPWYIFWLLQGALLGLIFYFAVRGGVLLVTINREAQSAVNLNAWSLAAIGALVGLFSKYAIEKLRQVFIMVFTSKADLDREEAEEKLQAEITRKKLETELEQEEKKRLEAEMSRKKLETELKK